MFDFLDRAVRLQAVAAEEYLVVYEFGEGGFARKKMAARGFDVSEQTREGK
jgi:hypothetical protein